MFETPGAIANDTSLLLAERSKKRGWKRQKTQKAFIQIVNAGSGTSEKDLVD